MLTSHPALSVPNQRNLRSSEDVVDLFRRERVFVCPSGLHDFCSSGARHDLPVEDGLAG